MDHSSPEAPGHGNAGAVLAGASIALAAIALTRNAHAQPLPADAAALNTLLTTEWQLVHTYDAVTSILSMPAAGDPDASAGAPLIAVCQHFQSQHRDHASRLIALVQGDGGTPVTEASVPFVQPMGFLPTVRNGLRLAANQEKAAAIGYANALRTMSSQTAALTVAAIGGVEAQHFVVMYLLALGLLAPTMATASMGSTIVPVSFAVAAGAGTTGLESVADYVYT